MTTCAVDIESLWNEHHEPLFRYVSRRVSQKELIEDIVQNVFLRAWLSLRKADSQVESGSGWLFRIAHNLVIDCYRLRDTAKDSVELDAFCSVDDERKTFGDLLPDGGLPLEELAIKAESVQELHVALKALPEGQRTVIYRRLEGYEFEDIANEIGISQGAAKALQHRGHVSINNRLKEQFRYEGTTPQKSNRVEEVHRLLAKQGPMTVRQITTALRAKKSEIDYVFHLDYQNEKRFARLGTCLKGRTIHNIWGLVGVHDKEAA